MGGVYSLLLGEKIGEKIMYVDSGGEKIMYLGSGEKCSNCGAELLKNEIKYVIQNRIFCESCNRYLEEQDAWDYYHPKINA